MQIDWLTVSAQWLNFIILVYLLRHFLYNPIIRAMDRRQQGIEMTIELARQREEQAVKEAADYREKALQLEEQKAALLTDARNAADQERMRLVEQAKIEVDSMAHRWRKEIEHEKTKFQENLRLELIHMVISTSRKALLDLAGFDLEQALLTHFLERLQKISEQDKQLLLESRDNSAVLACSAELSEPTRSRITEALNQALGKALTLIFEPLPESACGVMLITPSYTLEWRLEHYFNDLERLLDSALTTAGFETREKNAE
ncbi:MAG: F0F1 ATP synthase subunit B family protein [Gammaproteobacteria bacterium]